MSSRKKHRATGHLTGMDPRKAAARRSRGQALWTGSALKVRPADSDLNRVDAVVGKGERGRMNMGKFIVQFSEEEQTMVSKCLK